MDRLVLFDIDGTLIKSSRGHHEAFSEAFKEVYDIDTDIDIIEHQGMTDQEIIIKVLKKNGLDEGTIKSKIEDCMEAMVKSFNKIVKHEEIIVLDGVRKLLEELDRKGVIMGLVTGNLEPIARGKTKKIGLNRYFTVGGFGSDDINRTNLVKLAIKMAEENFDFRSDDNIFLIGDAPQDMEAGGEAGVKTVGVTTGVYPRERLEDAGADFVLEDLKDTDKVLNIIFRETNSS